MKEVEINGKKYRKIKKYKHFTLFEDKNGFKTCFDNFDLGLVQKRHISDTKRLINERNDITILKHKNV